MNNNAINQIKQNSFFFQSEGMTSDEFGIRNTTFVIFVLQDRITIHHNSVNKRIDIVYLESDNQTDICKNIINICKKYVNDEVARFKFLRDKLNTLK